MASTLPFIGRCELLLRQLADHVYQRAKAVDEQGVGKKQCGICYWGPVHDLPVAAVEAEMPVGQARSKLLSWVLRRFVVRCRCRW